jgi:hypothetical protein
VDQTAPTSAARAAPPSEIGELLLELSVALHKFGMYPSGHPALEPVVGALVRRATRVLAGRDRVVLGVANRQLVVDGEPTDAAQPALRRLAEDLHRHQVGAIVLLPGLDDGEMEAALQALSRDPVQHGALCGRQAPDRPTWPHLQLSPLSFDGLALSGEEGTGPSDTEERGPASLWVALARLATAGGTESSGDVAEDPLLVAHAIEARRGRDGYDQSVLKGLVRIARELRTGTGPEVAALRRRTSRLVRDLSPDTLRQILGGCGSITERDAFLHDAVHGMAVESVLDIVTAAAKDSGETISQGLLRMLSKLAAHAELGSESIRGLADAALRDQVGALLKEWQLADPNPDAYRTLLQRLAETDTTDSSAGESAPTSQDPVRLVHMSLETGSGGPMVERAIDEAVAKGHAVELLHALSSSPDPASASAKSLLEHLLRPTTLRVILDHDGTGNDELDLLQPFMSTDHYRTMLDTLATTESRTLRRRLLDRLAQAHADLGPLIMAGLDDSRWFVQRNMLVLLERIGRVPDGFAIARWTAHPDMRVRHQAIRLQLCLPGERDAAVLAALQDGNPRLIHSGLAAIQQDCPSGLVEVVSRLASDLQAEVQLRVLAVRSLGRCRDSRALSTLLALTEGGRRLFFKAGLPTKSPVMLAALRALAGAWRADSRAGARVALALRASDPEIRGAAQGASE